jgi:hypothetical protein
MQYYPDVSAQRAVVRCLRRRGKVDLSTCAAVLGYRGYKSVGAGAVKGGGEVEGERKGVEVKGKEKGEEREGEG